jgi:hypothetical protein
MKCAHTTVYRGKRVLVRMKDGTKFIDRFHDSTHNQVVLQGCRVLRSAIKSMSIYREPLRS